MNSRTIFAIILVLLGVGFLIEELQIAQFSDILGTWWPTLIIGIGLYKIATDKHAIFFGIVIFLIGALLQALKLDIIHGSFWGYFWPLILIIAGIWLVTGRMRKGKRDVYDTNQINDFVIFGAKEERFNCDDFQGGSATALFGAIEIDLTDCKMKSYAELELTAVFGGIELRVPEEWQVQTNGMPFLGGMDNHTRKKIDGNDVRPLLNVRYTAAFGGVEVKN